MAIVYPILLPGGGDKIAGLSFGPHASVGVNESPFTFQQQYQAWQGKRWRLGVTLALQERETAAIWTAFFATLNGREGTFLAGDRTARVPLGTAGGAPVVSGGGQTGNVLVTSGWTAGATLKAGDYIQLNGDDATARLHQVLADATADGGGAMTLDPIWPTLRESPQAGAVIQTTDPWGVFRLDSPEQGWQTNADLHYQISFTASEVP